VTEPGSGIRVRFGIMAVVVGLVLAAGVAHTMPFPKRRTPPPTDLPTQALERIKLYVQQRDFQGSVLIARHDSVVFERTFVFGDTARRAAPRYGIASISKTFTAAAIQRLEQRGRLSLGDTLGRFIPHFPMGDSITIEQLLSHTAGIRDYYADADYPKLRSRPMTPQSFASWLAGKPLDFRPGTQSRYSNSGYALLADVIERASGESYDAFTRHELLDSLGLHDTRAMTRLGADAGLAPGFDPGLMPGGFMKPIAFDWSWLMGSGSLESTPRDLLRWTHAVLRDGLVDRRRHAYPYGWGVHERHHVRVIEQTGRISAGYASQVSYYPDSDLTVIVLANIQSESAFRLAQDLESYAFHETPPAIQPRWSIALNTKQLGGVVGQYEIAPGLDMTVRLQEGGPWLAGPDGDFRPLDTLGPNRFYFRVLDVAIEFARDSTGQATELVWNGQFRAKRVR
jgi:CubicO group peptidase (beta-lactamase class C family)